MCNRSLDPKSRRILAAGTLCLYAGISFPLFTEGFGHRHRAGFDGMLFLLVGLAISLLFLSARRSGGCAPRS